MSLGYDSSYAARETDDVVLESSKKVPERKPSLASMRRLSSHRSPAGPTVDMSVTVQVNSTVKEPVR